MFLNRQEVVKLVWGSYNNVLKCHTPCLGLLLNFTNFQNTTKPSFFRPRQGFLKNSKNYLDKQKILW